MTEEDRCIKIYLNYHVSQLKFLGSEIVDKWQKGQKLYEKKKLKSK